MPGASPRRVPSRPPTQVGGTEKSVTECTGSLRQWRILVTIGRQSGRTEENGVVSARWASFSVVEPAKSGLWAESDAAALGLDRECCAACRSGRHGRRDRARPVDRHRHVHARDAPSGHPDRQPAPDFRGGAGKCRHPTAQRRGAQRDRAAAGTSPGLLAYRGRPYAPGVHRGGQWHPRRRAGADLGGPDRPAGAGAGNRVQRDDRCGGGRRWGSRLHDPGVRGSLLAGPLAAGPAPDGQLGARVAAHRVRLGARRTHRPPADDTSV